jgi:sugar phosphate permease
MPHNRPQAKGTKASENINLMQAWVIWGAAAVFYLYEFLLRVSVSVMTHGLMESYQVTSTELGVLSSYYYFSYVALQIPCGLIVDRIGPRRLITYSSILCTIGAFLFAHGDTLWFAKTGRLLMGAGSACAFLSTLKVAADWFSPRKFVLAAGLTAMMGVLGGTFGQRPFAVLVNEVGWRMAMHYAALGGIVVTLLVWLLIRDRRQHHKEYHSETAASIIAGIKLIASNPQSWLIALSGCLMYLPVSVFAELWGTPYLMKMYHVDNEVASTANIMIFIGMAIGGPTAAWISNKIKSRQKVMFTAACLSFFCFLGVVVSTFMPIKFIFFLLFCVGICKGGQVLCFTCVKEINPSRISGTTVGFTNTIVMLSGMIFQPGLGLILDLAWDGSHTSDGQRYYSANDYHTAMWAFPVALFINCIVLWFVRETYREKKIRYGR